MRDIEKIALDFKASMAAVTSESSKAADAVKSLGEAMSEIKLPSGLLPGLPELVLLQESGRGTGSLRLNNGFGRESGSVKRIIAVWDGTIAEFYVEPFPSSSAFYYSHSVQGDLDDYMNLTGVYDFSAVDWEQDTKPIVQSVSPGTLYMNFNPETDFTFDEFDGSLYESSNKNKSSKPKVKYSSVQKKTKVETMKPRKERHLALDEDI